MWVFGEGPVARCGPSVVLGVTLRGSADRGGVQGLAFRAGGDVSGSLGE